MDINALFDLTIERNASDLHITVGYYPAVRINGELHQLTTLSLVTPEVAQEMLTSFLTDEQKENLLANKEIDIGYKYKDHRFRINIYYAQGTLNASFRLIPNKIKTIEQLGLPTIFHELTKYSNGLVLVNGPTGEGKSSTLAALINEININSTRHIITVEDPIEYVYPAAKSIIAQRELHQDTHSWNISLRSILREDPDVVLVGEMRDFESTQQVVSIAETGHLVFSTLHTSSAPETINRIIDIFPAHQQNQIRSQLATTLRAVVSQRLLPRADGVGRIPAVEIMYNNQAVASIIRDGKPYLLDNVIQTSGAEGFIYFEKYLYQLYQQGLITKDVALAYALRPKEITKFIT